jgi:hypothetical protein
VAQIKEITGCVLPLPDEAQEIERTLQAFLDADQISFWPDLATDLPEYDMRERHKGGESTLPCVRLGSEPSRAEGLLHLNPPVTLVFAFSRLANSLSAPAAASTCQANPGRA